MNESTSQKMRFTKIDTISPLAPESTTEFYTRVQAILSTARAQAWRAVNLAMVAAYWEVGRASVEEEQQGTPRAALGC